MRMTDRSSVVVKLTSSLAVEEISMHAMQTVGYINKHSVEQQVQRMKEMN